MNGNHSVGPERRRRPPVEFFSILLGKRTSITALLGHRCECARPCHSALSPLQTLGSPGLSSESGL